MVLSLRCAATLAWTLLTLLSVLRSTTNVAAIAPHARTPHTLMANVQNVESMRSPFVADDALATDASSQIQERSSRRDYQLQGLKPHTQYEVRASYLGSLPYSFSVSLLGDDAAVNAANGEEADATIPTINSARRLLDVEKVMFTTDAEGHIEGCAPQDAPHCAHPVARVEARWNGVTDSEQVRTKDIQYAIVLESLLPGNIPVIGVKVAIVLLAALLMAFCGVAPTLGRVIHAEHRRLQLKEQKQGQGVLQGKRA